MTGAELLVTAAGGVLIAILAWFFFGPKQARRAEVRGGMQEVEITVKGGYSPNLIRVQEGVPLRLVFDRQENSDCSSRGGGAGWRQRAWALTSRRRRAGGPHQERAPVAGATRPRP